MLHVYDTDILGLLNQSIDPAPRSHRTFFECPQAHARLICGDSMDVLAAIEANSADFVFADPPYFLSSGGITCCSGKRVCVDKGDWDRARSYTEHEQFAEQWLTEIRRILRPNGSICVSGTMHSIYCVGSVMHRMGFKMINDIIWKKPLPPPNLTRRCLTHASETILWAKRSAAARHTFNFDEAARIGGGSPLESVWTVPAPARAEKRFGCHPTQKPEALLDRIVRICTRPGDHILDPFCGSGTTGVICVRHGRAFTGIDREDVYLSVASKRISNEIMSPGGRSTAPKSGVREI